MNKDVLEYKGYFTRIHFDKNDRILYGKLEGITDSISFHSENASEIEDEFHLAVDDYLEACERFGKDAEKPFKGAFNVRVNPVIHRRLYLEATQNESSINAVVEKALTDYFEHKELTRTVIFNIQTNGEGSFQYKPAPSQQYHYSGFQVLKGGMQ